MFVMVVGIGFVMADEFNATITKAGDGKITYQKFKKAAKKGEAPEKDGDPVTINVAKDAKIVKGMFNKDTKKVEPGDKIEGGLAADVFKSEKGVAARITTDADNKNVTQIIVTGGGKKKKDAK
jgi:hypothetical protein